jgi:sugar diacid utilization regulator
MSLGGDMQGLEGFRRTHRQAREAQRIGMALRNRLTRYSDVAVEALALRDPDAACAFVEQVLGPLKQARNADKLRLTLAAYLHCGLNATAAATSIGANDRTMAYRLKVIEELTGQMLSTNRFELEAAVRLERVIGQMPGSSC